MGGLTGAEFADAAVAGLSPWFGGTFDPERFAEQVLGA